MADKSKDNWDDRGAGVHPIPGPDDPKQGFSPKLEEVVDELLGGANELNADPRTGESEPKRPSEDNKR